MSRCPVQIWRRISLRCIIYCDQFTSEFSLCLFSITAPKLSLVMISRQNRVPTGRTSNRPGGGPGGDSVPASARSTGPLHSSRTFEPPAMHSPIQRPTSKASPSDTWGAPGSTRGFNSSRAQTASSERKVLTYSHTRLAAH
jgi:hypothetical protein